MGRMSEVRTRKDNDAVWWMVFGIGVLAFSLIIGASIFPPITDLPQHMAQVRLLNELLGLEAPPSRPDIYIINYLAPNNLIYIFLWFFSLFLNPVNAGRLAIWLVMLSWFLAILFLTKKRQRSLAHALMASIFIFSAAFYWGFLNFLIGFPLFVVWLLSVGSEAEKISIRRMLWLILLSFLLFQAHVFWFALASAYLGLYQLILWIKRRIGFQFFIVNLIPLIPVTLLTLWWLPGITRWRAGSFDIGAYWFVMPWERLWGITFSNYLLGGMANLIELATVSVVSLWIFSSIWTNRYELKEKVDRPLMALALGLGAVAFLGPDQYMNTILFAQRWMPIAAIFLLLALPFPKLSRAFVAVPVIVVLLFAYTTAISWRLFDAEEMDGIGESLAQVKPQSRLLWLSFDNGRIFQTRPTLQIGAWAQAIHGAEVNFSFAEHGSGIVILKDPRQVSWSTGLEWIPERVTLDDIQKFDHVLVIGSGDAHQKIKNLPGIEPVTDTHRASLYNVVD